MRIELSKEEIMRLCWLLKCEEERDDLSLLEEGLLEKLTNEIEVKEELYSCPLCGRETCKGFCQ